MATTTTETLYVVRVHARHCDDGCPYDAFFGHEPVVYRSLDEAEAHAAVLSTTGDWGEAGPPSYYVEEVAADDLYRTEQLNVERYGIGR